MVPRHAHVLEAHGAIRVAAHDVGAFRQRPILLLRDELRASCGMLGWASGSRRRLLHVAMEPVSTTRHGPDESRGVWGVADRRAHFSHEVVQTGVGDERAGPQVLEELAFRDDFRSPFQQEFEQLKRPRRQWRGAAMPEEFMTKRVELARPEDDRHVS
jgi:hypothetical protein